jgi:hypothetical protein
VVNRALLNTQFPPGTLSRNTGDVFLDDPSRTSARSRQFTVGFERQLLANLAARVDYIHSKNDDQLVRFNLNPPTRTSTSRTAPVVRPNPEFVQNVWEPVNLGEYSYNAVQFSVDKRYSRGYNLRVSYAYSRARGNFQNDFNSIITTQVGDDLRLDDNEGLVDDDRPHILSISGSAQIPRVTGLSVSGVGRYMSGLPFSLIDSSLDSNRNGRFEDEFLPPGSYSGTGQNAVTVENKGGRNGARGPDFFEIDLRVTYSLGLRNSQRLQLFGEVFNLTNRANFLAPTNSGNASDRRLASTFLILRTLRRGATSQLAQFGIRYSF